MIWGRRAAEGKQKQGWMLAAVAVPDPRTGVRNTAQREPSLW